MTVKHLAFSIMLDVYVNEVCAAQPRGLCPNGRPRNVWCVHANAEIQWPLVRYSIAGRKSFLSTEKVSCNVLIRSIKGKGNEILFVWSLSSDRYTLSCLHERAHCTTRYREHPHYYYYSRSARFSVDKTPLSFLGSVREDGRF